MTEAKIIVKNWYEELEFPKKYDDEFYNLLAECDIDTSAAAEEYNLGKHDGGGNLLMQLYFLESIKKEYEKKGIPDDIFFDTMQDIVRWTNVWSGLENKLCLNELLWLRFHLTGQLYKIGRLQFCMQRFDSDFPEYGIHKGEGFLDVHIPSAGPLTPSEVDRSFVDAIDFFSEYFPEFEYRYFACFSWLLDDTLKKYMRPDSNTLRFAERFTKIHRIPSDDILKFTFKWNTKRSNLSDEIPTNSFGSRIKEAAMSGEEFFECLGIIDKKKIK